MPYQFHQIATAPSEAEYLARMRIPPEPLLNLQRQRVHASPHVGDAARDPDSHSRRKRDHRPSTTERSRASASGSTLAGTTSWRPFLRAISTRASGFGGTGLGDIVPGNSAETISGIKEGKRSPPSSPVRYRRRQTVSRDREMSCRLAVALTCRFPVKLSSTIRTLSASFQCRRRTPSAADKTSIGGSNLRSRIRSELSLKRQNRQAAFTGGIPAFWPC